MSGEKQEILPGTFARLIRAGHTPEYADWLIKGAQEPVKTAPSVPAITDPDNITTDQYIELAEELVWAKIRMEIAATKEIAGKMQDGPFRSGMESACEEIEVRLGLTKKTQAQPPAQCTHPDTVVDEGCTGCIPDVDESEGGHHD